MSRSTKPTVLGLLCRPAMRSNGSMTIGAGSVSLTTVRAQSTGITGLVGVGLGRITGEVRPTND